jgi:hypothetical protein
MSSLGPVKILRQNVMEGTVVVETQEREEKILKVGELFSGTGQEKTEKE